MQTVMKLDSLLPLTLLASSALAQSYVYLPASANPAAQELNSYSFVPFMQPSGKVQFFYKASEVGASTFLAREIAFRYDGPTPKVGVPGPFTIARLRIEIGTTTVLLPGAEFEKNLTTPLSKAFEQSVSFLPDSSSATPDIWGGPGGGMAFPFASPVAVVIPANAWFVVQLTLEANTNRGLAHAILDAQKYQGIVDGSATSNGIGCTAGISSSPALILTSGTYAPGSAHSIYGSSLGANAPVLTMIGASDQVYGGVPLPYTLPGTNCSAYASFDFTIGQFADITGAILPQSASSFLTIPADPAFSGAQLFEQHVALVPSANSYGIVMSDKRNVVLGSYSPPVNGVWYVANGDSATAPAATLADALGFALRIRTN